MLKNIVEGKRMTETEYKLEFTDRHGNGCSFPCDENGNVTIDNDAAQQNYQYCLEHPEEYEYYNRLKTYRLSWTEPAHGVCSCGAVVELVDEYLGACECENCGQWYNLFGEELLDPKYWDEDVYESEPW